MGSTCSRFGVRLAGVLLPGVLALLGGCAAGPGSVPYPAFMALEDVEYTFLAELPGIRAKRLSGDLRSGRFSALLYLPESWRWNTGAAPGKSVEIYVIAGEITLADLELTPGNHAYLPPGSTGLPLSTTDGAQILYFLDEGNPAGVIQTPLFMSRDVVPWQSAAGAVAGDGLEEKELRGDPGSGARTWLLRVPPGAELPWQQSSVALEGFLLSGEMSYSECVDGKAVTGNYVAGGYFRRPSGAVHGGPHSQSESGATWLLRRASAGTTRETPDCTAATSAFGAGAN